MKTPALAGPGAAVRGRPEPHVGVRPPVAPPSSGARVGALLPPLPSAVRGDRLDVVGLWSCRIPLPLRQWSMGLSWGQTPDGGYAARASEGSYRIERLGDEWCLEKPFPRAGRIGGFSSAAEAMAWGDDLHSASSRPPVQEPVPDWPTVDELAREIDLSPSALRSWIAAHVGGSTSPRRRLEPAVQRRVRSYWEGT